MKNEINIPPAKSDNRLRRDLFAFLGGFMAVTLLVIGLVCLQSPPARAQSFVGVNTRFGGFTNNLFGPAWSNGPGLVVTNQTNAYTTNGTIELTNTQMAVIWTNTGNSEVALDSGRGLGLFVVASSTNIGATNTVNLYFDVSPLGSTNKTSGILAGPNTNLIPFGAYGGYTGTGSNTTSGDGIAFLDVQVTVAGSNTVTFFTNIPPAVLDNARWIRLSAISNALGGGSAGNSVATVNISNILWSKFP
jgi:hypothetical protein